jgi:hypothetical protein
MGRFEEDNATVVSRAVALDEPVNDALLAIAHDALSMTTAMVTIMVMPGADRDHLEGVVENLIGTTLNPDPGEPLNMRTFRKHLAKYLRELADRVEPIE